MIFENTWQGETVLHEAFIDDNADVSIREVSLGGDPIEDFVSYTIIIVTRGNKTTSRCDTNLTVILPLCLWLFCPCC